MTESSKIAIKMFHLRLEYLRKFPHLSCTRATVYQNMIATWKCFQTTTYRESAPKSHGCMPS